MNILELLDGRLAVKKQEPLTALDRVAKEATIYAFVQKYGVKGKSGRKPKGAAGATAAPEVQPTQVAPQDVPAPKETAPEPVNAAPAKGYSDENMQGYLSGIKAMNDKHVAQNGGHWAYKKHYSTQEGKKYVKVIAHSAGSDGKPLDHSGSVHSFIDKTNGNILKPNSWKAPHPIARGNIGDSDHGMKGMGNNGPAYLKGANY